MTIKQNGTGMTEFVKQQGVIWFRIIITVLMIGAGKLMWGMNNSLVELNHTTKAIAGIISDIQTNKKDIQTNTTAIAVHEIRITNLEDEHD